MSYKDQKYGNVKGVIIDYELLGKVLEAKKIRFHQPVIQDPEHYLEKKLAVSKTVYPY